MDHDPIKCPVQKDESDNPTASMLTNSVVPSETEKNRIIGVLRQFEGRDAKPGLLSIFTV